MSKMTLSSKEQKIFSNTIWPIVSGAHLFFEKLGDKIQIPKNTGMWEGLKIWGVGGKW